MPSRAFPRRSLALAALTLFAVTLLGCATQQPCPNSSPSAWQQATGSSLDDWESRKQFAEASAFLLQTGLSVWLDYYVCTNGGTAPSGMGCGFFR